MAVLKVGAKGAPVEKLQEQLVKAGVKPKPEVDGVFGKGTAEAVKAYQKEKNLKPDGIVGKNTEAVLAGRKPPAKLPKGVFQKLKKTNRNIRLYWYAWMDFHDGIEKVQKELSRQKGLSEKEKAKFQKPLNNELAKMVKTQARLAQELMKTPSLLNELDKKSGDGGTKKLLKKGQVLDATAKKYFSYSKASKRKGTVLVDLIIKQKKWKCMDDLRGPINAIFMEDHLYNVDDAFEALYKEAKKAA